MARIPREESERVQAAIIVAAVEEMAQHGYAGLRIPLVAKRIGKTQGAVYGRFIDKQALALAAVESIRDKVFLPRMADLLKATEPPLGRLAKISAITAGIAREHPAGQRMVARLVTELASEQTPVAIAVRGLIGQFVSVIHGLLTAAHENGQLATSTTANDLETIALTIVGQQIGLATMANLFPERTNYPQLEQIMRKVLDAGLRHEPQI